MYRLPHLQLGILLSPYVLLHRAPDLSHARRDSGPQCHLSNPGCPPAEHVDTKRKAWKVPIKLRLADASNWEDGRRPGTLERWRGDVQHHTERLLRLALEVAKVHVVDSQVSALPAQLCFAPSCVMGWHGNWPSERPAMEVPLPQV